MSALQSKLQGICGCWLGYSKVLSKGRHAVLWKGDYQLILGLNHSYMINICNINIIYIYVYRDGWHTSTIRGRWKMMNGAPKQRGYLQQISVLKAQP